MPASAVFLLLYGIFAVLAVPVLVIALYVRYNKLRRQLTELDERSASQFAAFTREIADLKRQVATPHAAPAPHAASAPNVAPAPHAAPVIDKPSEIAKPAVAPIAPEPGGVPAPPLVSPAPAASRPAIVPAMPKPIPPVAIPPAPAVPPKPFVDPVQHLESKQTEAAKVAEPPKPVTEQKPTASAPVTPIVTPIFTPPKPLVEEKPVTQPSSPARPVVEEKPATTPPAVNVPPAAAARVSSPDFLPLRASRKTVQSGPPESKPRPTLREQVRKMSALEETLGTNWLTKLGISLLAIGLSLFGIWELQAMGPSGRAALLFAVSLLLLAGGIALEKRERYELLGRAGIGGGWALLFFTTFGIYHVQAMHVLDSLVLDSVLMLGVAVAMAMHTLRYRSQFVTGLAFLLAYTTVALSYSEVRPLQADGVSQVTVYGLLAGAMLSIGLIAIVQKMGWFQLEVFGILSTYLNHLYWLYRILGIEGAHGRHFPEYAASTAMLFFYWLAFRVSHVMRHTKTDFEEHISTTAAILNSALVLGALRFQSVHPELAYLALMIVGVLELGFGQAVKRRREAFVVLTVMGAALLLAAAPSHYTGQSREVAILWLVGTEVFLVTGVLVKEVVFRRIGLVTGLLVAVRLWFSDLSQVAAPRARSNEVLLAAGILFAVCAVVFYANVFVLGTRKREFFEKRFDDGLLTAHSYIGAVAAAAAAWALFTNDWTAIALAAVMLTLAALSRSFPSQHLQVQYAAMGLATLFRVLTANLHMSLHEGVHATIRLISLPVLAGAFYLTAKLAALRSDLEQRMLRGCFAACGSLFVGLLIWLEAPELWRPIAFVAFAVALSETARAFRYPLLAWHAHAVSLLAVFTALTADEIGLRVWHRLALRDFSATAVVAGLYWIASRPGTQHEVHRKGIKAGYTWAAAALALWMLGDLLPNDWVGVAWVLFALALVLVMRRSWLAQGLQVQTLKPRYAQLAWQANVIGAACVLWALAYNYDSQARLWNFMNLRVAIVSLIAAGLYFLARMAWPAERWKTGVAFVQSFFATGMLALLAWYEAPNGWLAPLWAVFALVLALVDMRWKRDELRWQAHALSLLALGRCVVFNLHLVAEWRGYSVRLLSLVLVAVIFYALSQAVRLPAKWREQEMHHAYSWAASTLISLMLWFELQPLSIAVGWAVFGLVLFEYGLFGKVVQFRYQAYVALTASFVRIFFANLNAHGRAGDFWGPRMYTVMPLVLIFFFVYAQLPEEGTAEEKQEGTERDRRWRFNVLLPWLGTAALAALFYFQFPVEWVVTSWAALSLVLFAVAYWLDRPVFLLQGLAMTLWTAVRGLAHNLYGSGYFREHDWQGRYAVLGSAAALLLASLAFAFPLRERYRVESKERGIRRAIQLLASRPEQLQFFAAILLMTLMLALKLNSGMVTVAWGIEGVAVILLALAVGERSFRLTGLGVLLLCVGKVVAMDAWRLEPRDRYITFIIVGAALLLVSYLYTRYREAIRQFL